MSNISAPLSTNPENVPPASAQQQLPGIGLHPVRLYIIFHSLYHHVYTLAELLRQGAQRVPGVEVKLFRVEETLSKEILEKMHVPSLPDVPVITAKELADADGFLFGTPTRYGIMSGQMKTFWDTTGGLWMSGALRGKMAGLFFSTAGQHGGQETTALTFLTTLAHQGIIFVPMGAHDNLSLIDEVVGGSYYGCGTLSGVTGERKVTPAEREMALFQGEQFATALANYVVGARVRNSQSAAAIAANPERVGGGAQEVTAALAAPATTLPSTKYIRTDADINQQIPTAPVERTATTIDTVQTSVDPSLQQTASAASMPTSFSEVHDSEIEQSVPGYVSSSQQADPPKKGINRKISDMLKKIGPH